MHDRMMRFMAVAPVPHWRWGFTATGQSCHDVGNFGQTWHPNCCTALWSKLAQSVTYCGTAICSLPGEKRTWIARGLVDELHFALSPVVLGQGEAMFAGIDLPALGYRVTEHQATEHATHVVLGR
jgi:hypothetical protein